MQRVCPCPGGIKSYSPHGLLDEETRRCPLCPSAHRLRVHGLYERYAILVGGEVRRISVLRLLCVAEKRTVSLLPDFCLPRRQHGPAILGIFLLALSKGVALAKAFAQSRTDASGHSVAQSLLAGFLSREARLKVYLARLRPRPVDPPPGTAPNRRWLAALVFALVEGFSDVTHAFCSHACRFHARFGLGLA